MSVAVDILDEHCRPVGEVEDDEEDWDEDLADVLNLEVNAGTKDNSASYLLRGVSPLHPDVVGDHYELEDAGEDEDHADKHPDVEQVYVGDAGDVLPDGAEHGGEGEHGGHPHGHPPWHRLGGHEQGQPGDHHKHWGRCGVWWWGWWWHLWRGCRSALCGR